MCLPARYHWGEVYLVETTAQNNMCSSKSWKPWKRFSIGRRPSKFLWFIFQWNATMQKINQIQKHVGREILHEKKKRQNYISSWWQHMSAVWRWRHHRKKKAKWHLLRLLWAKREASRSVYIISLNRKNLWEGMTFSHFTSEKLQLWEPCVLLKSKM